ncbi:MAG: hypothetical protein VX038_01285 [Verrucomicrobiota bacterium]|nr:hypothetical protein [Verrucomicrobiota bacterium]
MYKNHIYLTTVVSCLVIICGCATKKKGEVTSEDKEAWENILEIDAPEFESVGDPDMDQLLGETFETYVNSLSSTMTEIRSTLTTNRDYQAFTSNVATKAKNENISNSEASNSILISLKEKSDGGDGNATKRLDNIQEALNRVSSKNEEANKNAVNTVAMIIKSISAFNNLKSKVDEAGTLQKVALAAKFAKGLAQLNEFSSYAKTCKEFTNYMKNQINNPVWSGSDS